MKKCECAEPVLAAVGKLPGVRLAIYCTECGEVVIQVLEAGSYLTKQSYSAKIPVGVVTR